MTQVIINDILPYTQAVAILNQTVFGTDWTVNYPTDVVVYQTPFGDTADDATQILTTSQYSVALIGDQQEVQVTLVAGAGAGDLITITRQTPADRENLYTNTNFTPSMLNNDFGILTLVDQQAQLVNSNIAPRYNYSALINVPIDTILPILIANQGWVKNSNNTAFIGYTFPESGIAPADDTYVLLTPDSNLPNSLALSTLNTGFMVSNLTGNTIQTTTMTGTSGQIIVTNGNGVGTTNFAIASNPIIPGSAGMGIPIGTTAQRIIPVSNIALRYNTTIESLEYYNGTVWSQINDDTQVLPGTTNELAWYAANGDQVSPLPTADNGILITSNTGVPSISSTLPSAVQLNITEIGTISTGVWEGTILTGTYGGTGVDNGASTITIGGNVLFSGAYTFEGVLTANTDVTFPNSGTLATTSQLPTPAALTKTNDTNVTLTLGGSPTVALLAATSITLGWTGTLAVARGGTGVGSVTVAPTASAFAGWDANSNLSANSFIEASASTATAASTTTLLVGSAQTQFFTGTTTQTVKLPVTSTLALNQSFKVVNNSTGVVTVESSGANTVQAMAAGSTAIFNVILTSGTTAASWSVTYIAVSSGGSAAGSTNDIQFNTSGAFAASTGNFEFDPVNYNFSAGQGAAIGTGGNNSTSIGNGASITGGIADATAVGWGASVAAARGSALGSQATVTTNGFAGTAIGYGAVSNAQNAMAIGYCTSSQNGAMMIADGSNLGITPNAQNQLCMAFGNGYRFFSNTTLTFTMTTAGTSFLGTTTNNNAAAGWVGEIISSNIASGSAVSVSSGVAANITSISLTAGDWDVSGTMATLPDTTTTTSFAGVGISQTSATFPTLSPNSPYAQLAGVAVPAQNQLFMPTGTCRISLATTTTIYLVGIAGFAISTMSLFGFILARRAR